MQAAFCFGIADAGPPVVRTMRGLILLTSLAKHHQSGVIIYHSPLAGSQFVCRLLLQVLSGRHHDSPRESALAVRFVWAMAFVTWPRRCWALAPALRSLIVIKASLKRQELAALAAATPFPVWLLLISCSAPSISFLGAWSSSCVQGPATSPGSWRKAWFRQWRQFHFSHPQRHRA